MTRTQTTIPVSHQNEWKSKRKFEEAMEPWYLPFSWTIRDYGIDGQVEITKPIQESLDVEPQGQYFLVQLKCIENAKSTSRVLSYSIPVKKIYQWHQSNLPVLLSLYDLKAKEFHSIWIDDTLISELDAQNPKWYTKESVSVKIPPAKLISLKDKSKMKDYVINWRRSNRKIIPPGLYFDLKQRCESLTNNFAEIAKPFHLASIADRIAILENQIHEAIYRVVITGPSRTGKSSLVNALLAKREISPTGIFQTTGVPIQILPKNKEEVQVLFEDGTTKKFPFSAKVVRSYASQDENVDNKKKVSIVSIYTQNSQLEKGISLFDVPGLDDPIESIYEHAWMILRKSNAIFYLIDGSPAANGGFSFKSEYKREIEELSEKLDKVFLVITKVNTLKPARLLELKQKVNADLKRLNLFEKVSEKIYYISAEESLAIRTKKIKKQDSVLQLENDLWEYLLKENKVGIRRLSLALENLMVGLGDFSGLLNARLLDMSTKRELIGALKSAEKKLPSISTLFQEQCNRTYITLKSTLENHKNRSLEHLEKQLLAIPSQNPLPNNQQIKNYLDNSVKSTLEQTNQLYAENAHGLNYSIKQWIESNFKHISRIVSKDQDQRTIDMSEFETIDVPDIDLSNSFGVAAITWLASTVLAPGYSIAVAVASFFSNFFLTMDERRDKRISKLMNQIKTKTNVIYKRMESGYIDAFMEWSEQTRYQANNSIKLYLSDLQRQANKIDVPITPTEDIKYTNAMLEIENLKSEVIELNKELVAWHLSF